MLPPYPPGLALHHTPTCIPCTWTLWYHSLRYLVLLTAYLTDLTMVRSLVWYSVAHTDCIFLSFLIVLAFHHYNKITWDIHLIKRKGLFLLTVLEVPLHDWCSGPEVRQHIMDKSAWWVKVVYLIARQKRERRDGILESSLRASPSDLKTAPLLKSCITSQQCHPEDLEHMGHGGHSRSKLQ